MICAKVDDFELTLYGQSSYSHQLPKSNSLGVQHSAYVSPINLLVMNSTDELKSSLAPVQIRPLKTVWYSDAEHSTRHVTDSQ